MLRKNILVIISEKDNNEEFKKWIKTIFSLENLNIFFFDNNKEKIDARLVVSDYVINFLNESVDYEYVQKKIELLNIDFFGNRYSDVKLFSEKNNFKKIIEKSDFKTPIFEKVGERTPLDLFNNFPQPSRIFSKENNFFSERIDSLREIEKNFFDNKNISKYFIEEYIEGEEIYAFSFMQDNLKKIFIVKNNNGILEKIDESIHESIEKDLINFLEYSGVKEFSLFNLIYSKKRGLYFLNIFLKNSILYKYNKILDEILEINKYKKLKEILKKDLF